MKQILIWLCYIILSIEHGIKLSHHNISDAQEHEKPGQHFFAKCARKLFLLKVETENWFYHFRKKHC